MSAPIDEGRPVFVSRSSGILTMTNLATACRAYGWDPTDGNDNELDYSVWYPGAAAIANNTTLQFEGGVSASQLARNLYIYNALTYFDKAINKILFDILFHQAHVGQLIKRLKPNADAGTNNWARSSGSSSHYTYIDEDFDNPSFGNFLNTTTANTVEKFGLEDLPSNVTLVHEAYVMVWMAMTAGTDTGMAIQSLLTDSSDTPFLTGVLGTGEALFDCVIDGTATPRTARGKMEALDCPVATFNGARLHLISKRGAAGGTPNPQWWIYAVEVLTYCEVNDIEIIDAASFSALDAACASHLLRFSEWDGSFDAMLLDALAHKPSLYLYIDSQGRMALGQLVSYASVSTPLDLSAFVREIIRGPYTYRERSANVVVTNWGMKFPYTGAGGGPSAEDPVNETTDRGTRRFRRGATSVAARGFEDGITLDRHYIAGAPNIDVAYQCADEYVDIWCRRPDGIDAFDIRFDMPAIDVEPGQVVVLTIPNLGMVARKLCVVSNTYDADDDTVMLTLYDIEFTL